MSVMSVTDAIKNNGIAQDWKICAQVVEAMHAKEDDSQIPLKPLEAMLSIDLAHPNIIHTYKFYTRIRQVWQQLISCAAGPAYLDLHWVHLSMHPKSNLLSWLWCMLSILLMHDAMGQMILQEEGGES